MNPTNSLTVWESLFQSFQHREKNTLQIPFPLWSCLLLPSRLYLLGGEFPNPLHVTDELGKVFFWWFGFFGCAELVVCWRLPSILWYMCICCNRVTEERQALLGRVSEVNLESLDQRSVWFYIGNVLLVLHLWTHLFLLKKIEQKLSEWAFKWKCCQILQLSPEDNSSFVFTAVDLQSEWTLIWSTK